MNFSTPPQGRRERYWWWVALGSNVSLLGSFPLHVWKWICFLQTNSFPVWANFNYFHVALLPHIAIRYTVFIIYIYIYIVQRGSCSSLPVVSRFYLWSFGSFGSNSWALTLPIGPNPSLLRFFLVHLTFAIAQELLGCFAVELLPLRFFENFSKDVSTKKSRRVSCWIW